MLSQVFLAFDPFKVVRSGEESANPGWIAHQILEHLQLPSCSALPPVHYPGERVLQTRKENLEKGIPVDPAIWHQLESL